jgi:glycosyltransferase involved in cell wall biosynthesis
MLLEPGLLAALSFCDKLKMKILVINYEYPPLGGGGGFVTRDIIEDMAVLGHRVSIVTSRSNSLAARETVNGVDVVRVPILLRHAMQVATLPSLLSYPPSCVWASLRQFGKQSFDIVNTHFAVPSGPAGFAVSKLFKIPNVLSIHGGDIFDPSKTLSPHKTPGLSHTVRWMLKAADRVVAQSSDTRDNARRHYGIDRPIDIISLGIKKPVFIPKCRSELGIPPGDFVVCTIGRLVKRKNIDDALQILSTLLSRTNLTFLVIGDGPEKPHLEKICFQLNMGEKVRFLGNVSDETKFQLLAASDCYISTAMHEGFGLVFLEAMECGLPIVCYNRGGQVDFLASGATGFLVELGDREGFADKLRQLIDHPELRERFRNRNQGLITNYYIRRCAERYLALFTQVLAGYR